MFYNFVLFLKGRLLRERESGESSAKEDMAPLGAGAKPPEPAPEPAPEQTAPVISSISCHLMLQCELCLVVCPKSIQPDFLLNQCL